MLGQKSQGVIDLKKNKRSLVYALPVVLLSVVGCGGQSLSPSAGNQQAATNRTAAAQQFNTQEHAQIQSINQAFVEESKLFKEMSTKQISYQTFQTAYQKVQAHIKDDISSIRNAAAPAGSANYKNAYVALLNEGVKVFADQEKAIASDGTVNKEQAAKVRKEMQQFVSDSKELASKYGLH